MSEREQFEAWFEEHTGWDAEDYPNKYLLDVCYEAWQASREALKAEQGEDSELLAAAKKLDRDVGGILDRIKQGAVDGWISCADRMPENSQDVTVFSESKGVINGYYFGWSGEDKKWYAACGEYEGLEEDVTHWHPLPSPPAINHPIDTTPNQYDALGKGGEQ